MADIDPEQQGTDPLEQRLRESRRLLEDAPEHVIARALALWRAPQATTASAEAAGTAAPGGVRAAWRRLVATIASDSAGLAAPAPALALRSEGDGSRQLLYFSEGRDIDVRISPVATPDGRRWRIAGQVLGPDEIGTAELRCGAQVRRTAWSELAEFSFDGVGPGALTLRLRGPDWEIELPEFDVPG